MAAGPSRNCRVVLLVVDAEELFDNRRIPVYERACQNFEGNLLFIGFGHWGSQLFGGHAVSWSEKETQFKPPAPTHPGVTPSSPLKIFVKWLWSTNPQVEADLG